MQVQSVSLQQKHKNHTRVFECPMNFNNFSQ